MRLAKKGGFTLVELIVVIMVIGALSFISYPSIYGYVKEAKSAVDLNTLRTLNLSTILYGKKSPSQNPFEINTNNPDTLMQVLIDSGLLDEKLEPQQKDALFKWDFDKKEWFITKDNILSSEHITMGTVGHTGVMKGSYSGSWNSIIIPKTINDIVITEIYQDVFNGKNLTSVKFSEDSCITRIHARAFKSNKLTEIIFPDSLKRIDYGAFLDNDIVKIKIGSNVELEGNVFRNNDKFKDIYILEGAGTYLFVDDNWIKQ